MQDGDRYCSDAICEDALWEICACALLRSIKTKEALETQTPTIPLDGRPDIFPYRNEKMPLRKL